tara:strand:+ start:3031 stop:3516 length:486 start_codon:yes stop_codon:yes gene_type:complete
MLIRARIKTLFLYFIRNLFKFLNIIYFLLLILLVIPKVYANENLNNFYCGVSNDKILNEKSFITKKEENFDLIVNNLSVSKKFNLLIASEYTPKPGYKMSIIKIKKKKEKITIYYEIEKKETSLITVITFPFCLLEIEQIENYNIKVKKRILKFLPFNIFN